MLGKIIGRSSTNEFIFLMEKPCNKFEYLQVMHREGYLVLAQIIEIEKDKEKTVAKCAVIGHRPNKVLVNIRTPLEPNTQVFLADDNFVEDTLGLKVEKHGAYIGILEGRENIKINLDLNNLITRHVAVLARTGAGKCLIPTTRISLVNGGSQSIGNLVDKGLSKGFIRKSGVEMSSANEEIWLNSFDESSFSLKSTKIKTYMRRKSPKFLYEVSSRTGRKITLTEDHVVPIFNNGSVVWKKAKELASKDFLIIPNVKTVEKTQFIDLVDIWKDSKKVRSKDEKLLKFIREEIYAKNFNLKEISRLLDLSYTTFLGFFRESGIPLFYLFGISKILNLPFSKIRPKIINLHQMNNHSLKSRIKIDIKFSRFLGYLLAEGHNGGSFVSFSNKDRIIQKDFIKLLYDLFKIKPFNLSVKGEIRFQHTLLAQTLMNLGFKSKTIFKEVSSLISKSPKEVIASFLSAFIDGDGYVCLEKSIIEISSASPKLANQLSELFFCLGFVPLNKKKKVKGKTYSLVTVSGVKNLSELNKILNLKIYYKRKALETITVKNANPNLDIFPNIFRVIKSFFVNSGVAAKDFAPYLRGDRNPSVYTLKKIIKYVKATAGENVSEKELRVIQSLIDSKFYFDEVVSNEKIISKFKFVYDLETENNTFVANGFFVHNSYALSVLLEEIMDRNIPIVIFDPHGEYPSLSLPAKQTKKHDKFGIKAKGYGKKVVEFSPDVEKNPTARPLKLNKENLTGNELMHMLPAKLSSSQVGLLFAALKDMGKAADFEELMVNLQLEENNLKWTLISIIDYLRRLNLFSRDCTSLNDLVKPGRASVINLRGVPPEIQEVVAYKLISDLFNARKNSEVPPFFLVLEEAQNYVPERSFGEVKSSKVIRQVIAEGRKFGLGVAVVTQRPARIEKSVLSQCGTQIILKITNPGDLKTISTSVEGITSETEKEIRNLHIGKAMVVGIVDSPLFVEIRPKKSKHGGETVDIVSTFASLEISDESEDEAVKATLLNIIKPHYSVEDVTNMTEKEVKEIKQRLIPCVSFTCEQDNEKFNLLVNLTNGQLVKDVENGTGTSFLGGLADLSANENKIYSIAQGLNGDFGAADLFGKSRMQFAEVYELVKSLVKKDYFKKDGEKYALSEKIKMFNNLKSYAIYEQMDFQNLDYDKMFDEKYDWKEILNFFKKFVTIKSSKKCYLIDYEVHCVAKS